MGLFEFCLTCDDHVAAIQEFCCDAHARYQLHAITVIAVAVAVVMIVVIVVVILILTFFVVVIVILNFVIDSSVAIWVKSVCFAICAICQSPRMPAQRL